MRWRVLLLPLLALLAVAVVIGVQLASGGDEYVPPPPGPACVERALPPESADLERVVEGLVLLGVQRAACDLGISRERLLLSLPSARARAALASQIGREEAAVTAALKRGLRDAATVLQRAGRLPRASELLDDYAGDLGLPGIAESAITRLPDSVIDGLLPTGDVLRRAIDELDTGALLSGLGQSGVLEAQLRAAIRDAAIAEARERLREQADSLLPWR